jgi:hypothetical protein
MNDPGRRLPASLAWMPWWLSVALAIASYLALKYLAPTLAVSAGFSHLAGMLPQGAPIAAMGFLLLAAIQLYDGDDVPPEEPPKEPPEDEDDRPGDDAGPSRPA